jgi:hypothetical protein
MTRALQRYVGLSGLGDEYADDVDVLNFYDPANSSYPFGIAVSRVVSQRNKTFPDVWPPVPVRVAVPPGLQRAAFGYRRRPMPPVMPRVLQRYTGLRGLGDESSGDYNDLSNYYDPGYGTTSGANSNYPTSQPVYSPFEIALPSLISQGIKTVHDVWTPVPVGVAQAGAQNAALYAQQYARYPSTVPARTTETIGADSGGITLFGSRIGWVPILLVAGVLFFPGFQRRRNPALRNPRKKSNRTKRTR